MENKYRITKNTVSFLQLYIVFCPRYRRKIFRIPGVEKRFKELVRIQCEESLIYIVTFECGEEYVYLSLECPPDQSPAKIIQSIKTFTGKVLRNEVEELKKMPSLWTRNYLVSSESISIDNIKNYVKGQRKRY